MACRACNLEKGERLPSEWLGDQTPEPVAVIEARICKAVGNDLAHNASRHARRKAANADPLEALIAPLAEDPGTNHPWDRQENEPDREWLAFQYYRDTKGTRSYARVHVDNIRVPTAQVQGWADLWSWKARCLAHDKFLEAIRQEEKEAQAREAVAQVERIRSVTRELALEEAEKALAKSRASGHQLFEGTALVRLVEANNKIETLAQGKPTEIQSAKVDLSGIGTEDLARFLQELQGED